MPNPALTPLREIYRRVPHRLTAHSAHNGLCIVLVALGDVAWQVDVERVVGLPSPTWPNTYRIGLYYARLTRCVRQRFKENRAHQICENASGADRRT